MRERHNKRIKIQLPAKPVEVNNVNDITAGKILAQALEEDNPAVGISIMHAVCEKAHNFRCETCVMEKPYGPDRVVAIATASYQEVPIGIALWSADEEEAEGGAGDFFRG